MKVFILGIVKNVCLECGLCFYFINIVNINILGNWFELKVVDLKRKRNLIRLFSFL